jgi:hypothetical protein
MSSRPSQDANQPHSEGPQEKSRRRRPRKFTLRWWSMRHDLPLSTLYRAVQRGFLKAHRPRGGSYVVRPKAFKAWYGTGTVAAPRPQPAMPAERASPIGSGATFRHVRWDQLPDDSPDEH